MQSIAEKHDRLILTASPLQAPPLPLIIAYQLGLVALDGNPHAYTRNGCSPMQGSQTPAKQTAPYTVCLCSQSVAVESTRPAQAIPTTATAAAAAPVSCPVSLFPPPQTGRSGRAGVFLPPSRQTTTTAAGRYDNDLSDRTRPFSLFFV